MDWLTVFAEIVASQYAKTGKAFLLANATRELERRQISLQTALAGRKLKDVLQEEATSLVRVVRDPDHPLVWGALPTSIEEPADLVAVFGNSASKAEKSSRLERFSRGVWLAFAKPLKVGHKRYLEIGPPSRYYDILEDAPAPPSGTEIDPSFIYNPSGDLIPNENYSDSVEKQIEKWASVKSVPVDRLLRSDDFRHKRNSATAGNYDFLDLSNLSSSDKSRILIPLDILPKIIFGRQ